jgi:phosphoribosyl 1,2-cyclic phosphodiesterase
MNIDGDHSKAIKDIMRAGITCHMSEGTRKALNVSGHRINSLKPLVLFEIGTFKILPFPTQHDCAEPFGFLIQSNKDKLVFITDSYFCRYKFKKITHWMIECNYSKEILEENIKDGTVHAAIRNRIVKSHFELENVKKFFMANDLSKTKEIHLIHISQDNGNPELFKKEIQEICGKPTYV